MEKEIKIVPPKGYEIDKENSTFDCIKFKFIQNKKWRYDEVAIIDGYYITYDGCTNYHRCLNIKNNWGVFATEKQAKSALAMARISQIVANDERFGGVVTDEEWKNNMIEKHTIYRYGDKIVCDSRYVIYHFLAFHTDEQRDLFFEENEDLVKDYLMIN